jgi:hypothetical protein
MSKTIKLLLLILLLGGIGFGIYWRFKPKAKDLTAEKELNIEELNPEATESAKYEDWAGFSFAYPKALRIEPIELDDETVYSSLEMFGPEEKTLTLRISDTQFKDLDSWQKEFEKNNLVVSAEASSWVDIPALRLTYGAPEKLLTVAVENQVLYQIENLSDSNGFWDSAQQMILDSFKFSKTAASPSPPQEPQEEDTGIILLEETIE